MDPGETPAETALREAHEEVGLDPSLVDAVRRARPPQHGRQPQPHRARSSAACPQIVPLGPASPEVERVFWLPLAELVRPDTYHSERWGRTPDRSAAALLRARGRDGVGRHGAHARRPADRADLALTRGRRRQDGALQQAARPAATWRHSVARAPIENRSATRAVEHGAGEQHRAGGVGRARSGRRCARVAASSPARRSTSRLSGCGATISKRSSAATSSARRWVSSTWRRIIAWIAADAVEAQRQPQLQRPEAPAERDLPVAVVDRRAGLGRRRAQVLGQDATARRAGPPGRPSRTGRSRS